MMPLLCSIKLCVLPGLIGVVACNLYITQQQSAHTNAVWYLCFIPVRCSKIALLEFFAQTERFEIRET